MGRIELCVIGPTQLVVNDREIAAPSPLLRVLLCYLVLERRRVLRSQIVELLWPDCERSAGRASLRTVLSRLRALVGKGVIATEADAVFVDPAYESNTDLQHIERLVALADEHPDEPLVELCSILHHCEGRFLDGLPGDGSSELEAWLSLNDSRVDVALEAAFERATRYLGDIGSADEALVLARRWLDRDPRSAAATVRCMQLAVAGSHMHEAVGIFELHRLVMEREGERPSPDAVRIYQRTAHGAPNAVSDPGTATSRRAGRVPSPRDSFVGREKEIGLCLAHLERCRLLTLWAPGGAGKTRLVLELAKALEKEYADGVWFVPLGDVGDPDVVIPTIASTFGITGEPGVSLAETLAAMFSQRRLVLILDNCEHLLETVAVGVDLFLQQSNDLRIVATSREPLGVAGELVVRLDPLGVPEDRLTRDPDDLDELFESPAVELFVDRATEYDPDFALTIENANSVVQICRQLDGMPLALEIASGTLRIMTAAEVARALDVRFQQIRRSRSDAGGHHDTIRSVLDWSYDLLDPEAATLLRRLSVFPAGCTLEAAQRVCSWADDRIIRAERVLSLIEELVRKSLVLAVRSPSGTRYRLYHLVRVFAAEKLARSGERAAAMDALVRWCLELSEERYAGIGSDSTPVDRELFRELVASWRPDLANLRDALSWCVESGELRSGLELVTTFTSFWWNEHLATEEASWLERLIPPTSDAYPAGLLIAAHTRAAACGWSLGDPDMVKSHLRSGLEIDWPDGEFGAHAGGWNVASMRSQLFWIAAVENMDGKWNEHIHRSVEIGRASQSGRHAVQALVRAARLLLSRGEHDEARDLYAEALSLGVDDHEFYREYSYYLVATGEREESLRVLENGFRIAAEYKAAGALFPMVISVVEAAESWDLPAAELTYSGWLMRLAHDTGYRWLALYSATHCLLAYRSLGLEDRMVEFAELRKRCRMELPEHVRPAQNQRLNAYGLTVPFEDVPDLDLAGQRPEFPLSVLEAARVAEEDGRRLAADDPESRRLVACLEEVRLECGPS